MFKVNNKKIKTALLLTYFRPCSSASIVNFGHAVADWTNEPINTHLKHFKKMLFAREVIFLIQVINSPVRHKHVDSLEQRQYIIYHRHCYVFIVDFEQVHAHWNAGKNTMNINKADTKTICESYLKPEQYQQRHSETSVSIQKTSFDPTLWGYLWFDLDVRELLSRPPSKKHEDLIKFWLNMTLPKGIL